MQLLLLPPNCNETAASQQDICTRAAAQLKPGATGGMPPAAELLRGQSGGARSWSPGETQAGAFQGRRDAAISERRRL